MQQNIALELNLPPELKGEPFFYNICKEFQVVPKIIEASLSTDVGWALMTVKGEEPEIEKLYGYFKELGITYKIKAS